MKNYMDGQDWYKQRNRERERERERQWVGSNLETT